MSYNNYLLNLANISNEIDYSLTYGYGDIAVTEINSLKALIAKSEKMIPILEAEACMAEAEELDREDKSFNYWMTMLYGNDSILSIDIHNTNKTNRLKRRKQNKKHHKADRYHGKPVSQSDKKYWDEQSGTFYRWDEKKKTFNSHKKPKIHRKRKTKFDRLEVAMQDREKDLYPHIPSNILEEYYLVDFELYNLVCAIDEEEAKINWKDFMDWNGIPTVECRYEGWYGVYYPSTELKHMYSRQHELQTRKDEILSMYGDAIFEEF